MLCSNRLLHLVRESLGLEDGEFQHSLPTIISWLHGERKSCSSTSSSRSQAQLKSWYSRLLFLLSRCSRLLTTDVPDTSGSGSTLLSVSAAGAAGQTLSGSSSLLAAHAQGSPFGGSQLSSTVNSSHASPKVLQLLGIKGPSMSSSPAAAAAAGAAAVRLGGTARVAAAGSNNSSSSRPGSVQPAGGSGGGSEAGSSQGGSTSHRARRKSAFGELASLRAGSAAAGGAAQGAVRMQPARVERCAG